MSTIRVLTKKGTVIEYGVLETVREIFAQLCGAQNECMVQSGIYPNRDFLMLTLKTGEPLIMNRRFICAIIGDKDENG